MNEDTSTLLVWVGATLIGVMIVVAFDLPALMLPVGAVGVPIAAAILQWIESADRKILRY